MDKRDSRAKRLLLIGESFSPWTKKARWALEYCSLAYDYKEYTPTLSEPGLRLRLKQWTGKISVPVLITGDQVLRDSLDIAAFANKYSNTEKLGNWSDIEPWNLISEAALQQGRTELVRRILTNNQALEESLPSFIPTFLRKPMRFSAKDVAARLDRKYADLVRPGALRNGLTKIREGLENAKSDYLLGEFSYADITMAAVLEVIAPIARTEPPLGPATQACWQNEMLASEFSDLVDWRNRLADNPETSYSQFLNADPN